MALVVAGRNVRLRAARCKEHMAKAWESYPNELEEFSRDLLSQKYGEYDSLRFQFSVSLKTLSYQQSDRLSFSVPYRIEQVFESLFVAEKGDVL